MRARGPEKAPGGLAVADERAIGDAVAAAVVTGGGARRRVAQVAGSSVEKSSILVTGFDDRVEVRAVVTSSTAGVWRNVRATRAPPACARPMGRARR